jgi:hypothetical protein
MALLINAKLPMLSQVEGVRNLSTVFYPISMTTHRNCVDIKPRRVERGGEENQGLEQLLINIGRQQRLYQTAPLFWHLVSFSLGET